MKYLIKKVETEKGRGRSLGHSNVLGERGVEELESNSAKPGEERSIKETKCQVKCF